MILSCLPIFVTLLVVIDAVTARVHSPIVERQLTDGLQNDCLLCAIESVQVEFEDGDAETFFECHVIYDDDDNVPTDVVFGIPFDIDLPEDFVMEHLVSLLDGATICIPGGEAIRSFNGTDLDIIDIPEDAEITLILEGQEDTGIELNLTSPRKVLVARVIGDSGAEVPVESPNILAGSIFGIGDQPYSNSMRDQYNRCSFGKLDFVPATSAEFPLAVVDVMIEDSLQGQNLYTRRYDYHIALQELLGVNNLQSEYDHVIFCVAAGTVVGGRTRRREWTAFAPRHTFSYYNSKFGRCDKLSALMHEVGHNLGLIHSGNPGDQYGDLTGAMGESLNLANTPRQCFNAEKNWRLQFYNDSQLELSFGQSWSGRLVAFVDYELADVERNEYVLVRVADVFLQYNRARGFNNETRGLKDKVVLVEPGTTSLPRHSVLLDGLGASESYSRSGVTIEVCSVNNDGPPDYADIAIYPTDSPSMCSNSDTPITMLTPIPTPMPTPVPTTAVTPAPTRIQTPMPTGIEVLNDFCVNAKVMPIGTLTGSTEGGAVDRNVTCVSPSSPAAWYTVIGTGGDMNVNTCWSETPFDTILVVLKGDCEVLKGVCDSTTSVVNNDDGCNGNKSTVTWRADLGAEYKVLVYGFSTSTGSFNLTMVDLTASPRVGHVAPNRDSPLSHVRSSSIKTGQLP